MNFPVVGCGLFTPVKNSNLVLSAMYSILLPVHLFYVLVFVIYIHVLDL